MAYYIGYILYVARRQSAVNLRLPFPKINGAATGAAPYVCYCQVCGLTPPNARMPRPWGRYNASRVPAMMEPTEADRSRADDRPCSRGATGGTSWCCVLVDMRRLTGQRLRHRAQGDAVFPLKGDPAPGVPLGMVRRAERDGPSIVRLHRRAAAGSGADVVRVCKHAAPSGPYTTWQRPNPGEVGQAIAGTRARRAPRSLDGRWVQQLEASGPARPGYCLALRADGSRRPREPGALSTGSAAQTADQNGAGERRGHTATVASRPAGRTPHALCSCCCIPTIVRTLERNLVVQIAPRPAEMPRRHARLARRGAAGARGAV